MSTIVVTNEMLDQLIVESVERILNEGQFGKALAMGLLGGALTFGGLNPSSNYVNPETPEIENVVNNAGGNEVVVYHYSHSSEGSYDAKKDMDNFAKNHGAIYHKFQIDNIGKVVSTYTFKTPEQARHFINDARELSKTGFDYNIFYGGKEVFNYSQMHESVEALIESRVGKILNEVVQSVGDGKYAVFSHKGKRLSKPSSKKEATERLGAIEYFKHQGK